MSDTPSFPPPRPAGPPPAPVSSEQPAAATPLAPVEAGDVGELERAVEMPTMGDLDRLSADLDAIDHTLAELDAPTRTFPAS